MQLVYGIFVGAVATVFALWVSKSLILNQMNLVNRKDFISDEATYQKLGRLMDSGEVSIYAHNWTREKTYSLSFTLHTDENGVEEKVENRIRNTNLDSVINETYDWASRRGYIKE